MTWPNAAAGPSAIGSLATRRWPNCAASQHRGRDRAIVAFTGEEAWVLLVGPHDRQDQIADAYAVLYVLVGHDAEALAERTKPPCCGVDGQAPLLEAAEIDRLVAAAKLLVRRR